MKVPTPEIALSWLAVFLLALLFHLPGRNWDEGALLHPDERFLCMVTSGVELPESLAEWFDTGQSHFNPYNRGFSTYVYGTLPLLLTKLAVGDEHDLPTIARTGRLLSGLFTVGTVLLLTGMARHLGSRRFALWVGVLMAACVLPIQQSHFYTADPPALFFFTLCAFFSLPVLTQNRAPALLPAGLAIGAALACRINLGLLLPWFALVTLTCAWKRRSLLPLWWGLAGLAATALTFRLLQPYAFDGALALNPQWLRDMRNVHAISTGQAEVPFTMQWVGRPPYRFALYNLVAWGMGLPLGLLALGGTAFLLWRHRRDLLHPHLLLAVLPLLVLAYHGRVFLHTMRYFLPAYPLLILLGGLSLRACPRPRLRLALAWLVGLSTLLYAFGFHSIYRQEHNRIAASHWIQENTAPGSVLLSEHWDDALPVALPAFQALRSELLFTELEGYHPDTEQKVRTMVAQLDQADLIVLSSRRLSESLPRMPERHPVMTRYYQFLRESQPAFGIEEVARFDHRPKFLWFPLPSHRAEEAFRVYDHPIVTLHRKTADWDPALATRLLTAGIEFDAIPDSRYLTPRGWNRGMLRHDQWERRSESASFAERFPAHSAGNQQPTLVWVLVLLLLGLLFVPLTHRLFPSFSAYGLVLARPLALLLVSWLAWFPAAMEWISFPVSLKLSLCFWIAVNATLYAVRHEDLHHLLVRRRRRWLAAEAAAWSVFVLILFLRSRWPELWHPWAGGEKPMDYAFLLSTCLSDYFPAANPWLSGAFINYYSFGFVLVATLVRFTGVSPDLAYNLAIPTFAAFAAAGLFALTTAFVSAVQPRIGRLKPTMAGALSVVLGLVCGNLAQWHLVFSRTAIHPNDGYWHASRAIRVPPGEVGPITEFPFFTYLYGDLHAHMMALPYAMLAMALSWQVLRRFHLVRVAACTLVISSLYATNAWDLPVQVAFLAAALVLPLLRRPALLSARFAILALSLLSLRLWFHPFFASYLGPASRFIDWKGPRSSLLDLCLIHGAFLLPLLLAAALLIARRISMPKGAVCARVWLACIPLGCLALIGLVELRTLEADIGRMNMVFKFYYQVWWLLSIAAALALALLLRQARRSRLHLAAALLAFLPASACLLYPAQAPFYREQVRVWPTEYRGLNGLHYLNGGTIELDGQVLPLRPDLETIRFLRRHARPLEVIAEAHRPEYQWGARISIYTGLPSVIGWNWHMRQQRPVPGDREVERRIADLETLYNSPFSTTAERILQRYNVRYLVVGPLERLTYQPVGLQKFDHMPGLQVVFRTPETTVYAY